VGRWNSKRSPAEIKECPSGIRSEIPSQRGIPRLSPFRPIPAPATPTTSEKVPFLGWKSVSWHHMNFRGSPTGVHSKIPHRRGISRFSPFRPIPAPANPTISENVRSLRSQSLSWQPMNVRGFPREFPSKIPSQPGFLRLSLFRPCKLPTRRSLSPCQNSLVSEKLASLIERFQEKRGSILSRRVENTVTPMKRLFSATSLSEPTLLMWQGWRIVANARHDHDNYWHTLTIDAFLMRQNTRIAFPTWFTSPPRVTQRARAPLSFFTP
jgi:hypothetical protein